MKYCYTKTLIVKMMSLVMLLIVFPARVEATSLWTDAGNYDIAWYSSEAEEYSISTPRQLAGLAYLVNHNGIDFLNKMISLTADIDSHRKRH